jgi:hypothetical protein
MALDQLQASPSGVEVSPEHESAPSGDDVKHQGNWTPIRVRPNADRKCSKERNENQRGNYANHA